MIAFALIQSVKDWILKTPRTDRQHQLKLPKKFRFISLRFRREYMKAKAKIIIGKLIIGALILNGFAGFAVMPLRVQAQKRAIIINADQPNVWTLEQAHYLLAQMHRRNLDLKAKSLDDLDANEINGLRFEVLRTMLELGVKFDQADLAANNLLSQNQEFNSERRQSLMNRRDNLTEESLELTRQISELETQRANVNNDVDRDRFDKEIAAKTALRARVDKEIEQINNELKTLTAPSGSPKSTQAEANFDPNKLPKSIFDDAFKNAVKEQIESFNKAPKLNAMLRLENFLQLQYEIIAKQLTLLRDEVGPGERLLFLELPQTVNASYDKADKKWAQSWWKIAGYTRREKGDSKPQSETTSTTPSPTPVKLRPNQEPITTIMDNNSLLEGKEIYMEEEPQSEESNISQEPPAKKIPYINKFINLDYDEERIKKIKDVELNKYLQKRKGGNGNAGAELSNRQVRTIELIPRQSSLNVNDINLKVNSSAFSFIASFLFGFGSSLKLQRQREQFSQFVQQELYSSAFGKGSREFGWTFMPMPGVDRLMSGVRTTYAAVIVPEEATSLVMETNGCYFPRSAYQPVNFEDTINTERWGDSRSSRGCGTRTKIFFVNIPNSNLDGSNDFWVKGISYQPVDKGKRIVVLISGKNFSSQIGVLVNGVPLVHSIGLAQPLLRDDSKAGKEALIDSEREEIQGRIERVDSNKIVFSFKMPKDFDETPTITLVAPGKAIDINWLNNVDINGVSPSTLSPSAENACRAGQTPAIDRCIPVADAMFKGDPARPSFRIDGIEAFRGDNGKVSVVVTGAGFEAGTQVFVNGVTPNPAALIPSKSLIVVNDVSALSNDKIQVTLTLGDKTVKSASIANPAFLKVDKVTVVSYEAPSGRRPAILVVRLDGTGFPRGLESLDRSRVKVTVTSSTEAFLRIIDPDAAEVVTLRDPVSQVTVNTVITRKPPK